MNSDGNPVHRNFAVIHWILPSLINKYKVFFLSKNILTLITGKNTLYSYTSIIFNAF